MNHPFLLWLLITCGAIAFMVGIVFVIAAAVAWIRNDTLGSVVKMQQHYPEDGWVYKPLYAESAILAAYAKGQEDMRERAAKECDWYIKECQEDFLAEWCARDIRALPITQGEQGRPNELAAERAISDKLEKALKDSRETLQRENDEYPSAIKDTIWHTEHETLFDFMDSAIAELAAMRKGEQE